MTRIYVTEIDTADVNYDPYEPDRYQPRCRAGYFTEERAEYWHGAKAVFVGSLADVNTRDQNRGQGLYRTAQGRWVLRTWSNWQGEADTHTYLTDDEARDWLVFNDREEIAEQYFGAIAEERGPGRPEEGTRIDVRIPDDVLAEIAGHAEANGRNRSAEIRALIDEALQARRAPQRTNADEVIQS